MLPILFNTVDYFGPKYERVLKCKTEAKSYFCLDLRAKLDAFKEDNFQWWQPHVTTDKVSISARITTYFIMKNKETLKQFELY